MPTARRRVVSARKLLVFSLNLASTLLTLFTGLRENPLLVLVTGRYDGIRARFLDGSVNYNNTNTDLVALGALMDLREVGKSYRFFSQPLRGPHNFLTDRSTCRRVNSMNVTRMNIVYDDFWGKGARRSQIYMFSISAPNCDVINFRPEWVADECVAAIGGGNETACHEHIFANFDALKRDQLLQVGVEVDFGVPGEPFLKCRGRPEREFNLIVDMILHKSYWAGGSWHLEIQRSDCVALPLLRDSDQRYGLFSLQSVNDQATAYSAAESSGWLATIISACYAIVSISLIVHGLFTALVRSTHAHYVPNALRFKGSLHASLLRYVVPSMTLARLLPPPEKEGEQSSANSAIRLKGAVFMASDVWMNHWLYISLSMLDALANMRMTYVIFQLGTFMLKLRASMETFLFMCSALGRMTWLLCLVHSVTRLVFKLAVRSARAFGLVRMPTSRRLEWYIDGSAMFVSYKLYSIALFVYMYAMLKVHKSTTFMVRLGRFGVYGGALQIAQFWKSEAICDYSVIFSILISAMYAVTLLMLRFTKYKHVVNNRVMRLLQARYVLVGWDAVVAMEALGIDPLDSTALVSVNDGDEMVAPTNCSLGALLQQLYTSGPSGLVHLSGDFIFMEGGFSREHLPCRFPIKRTVTIGLIQKNEGAFGGSHQSTATAFSKKYVTSNKRNSYTVEPTTTANSTTAARDRTSLSQRRRPGGEDEDDGAANETTTNADDDVVGTGLAKKSGKSLFDRKLSMFVDGRFGRILLVDEEDEPGRVERRANMGLVEFVMHDALTLTTILDIKPLLGNQKKLCIT